MDDTGKMINFTKKVSLFKAKTKIVRKELYFMKNAI